MSAPAPPPASSSHTAGPASLGARLVLTLGSLVFLHAAYSAYEFISVQKALGLSGTASAFGLPIDIRVETIAGLALVVVGLVLTAAPLRDITWASEYRTKSIDEIDARPSFSTLNHRGPFVFSNDD